MIYTSRYFSFIGNILLNHSWFMIALATTIITGMLIALKLTRANNACKLCG